MYYHQQSSQAQLHIVVKLHRSRQLYANQKLNPGQPLQANVQDVWLCLFDRTSDARNVTHACDRRGKKRGTSIRKKGPENAAVVTENPWCVISRIRTGRCISSWYIRRTPRNLSTSPSQVTSSWINTELFQITRLLYHSYSKSSNLTCSGANRASYSINVRDTIHGVKVSGALGWPLASIWCRD